MKADAALVRQCPDILAKMSCRAVDHHMELMPVSALR
jgi:hypothetical protein